MLKKLKLYTLHITCYLSSRMQFTIINLQKKLQTLQTTFNSIMCNGFTTPENFLFQNAKKEKKIQVLYKTTTKCVHTNKSHGVHNQCLLFNVLVSKFILMLQVIILLHDHASNILWKHVIYFRMNFMRIKYLKTFIKQYNEYILNIGSILNF